MCLKHIGMCLDMVCFHCNTNTSVHKCVPFTLVEIPLMDLIFMVMNICNCRHMKMITIEFHMFPDKGNSGKVSNPDTKFRYVPKEYYNSYTYACMISNMC